jgi:Zn-dependent protease with chaperone function
VGETTFDVRVGRGAKTNDVRRWSRSRILLDLPSFALSAVVVGFLANAVGFLPWGCVIVAAWLLSGPVVLIRQVEEAVIGGRSNIRKPTVEEFQRLAWSWRNVTQAAEIDPSTYSLWIERTHRVNAFATAGHTVAVTEGAASRLSGEQLDAVLAHELGHHLGGHAWASLLRYWYSLPGSYALGFGTYLNLALTSAFGSGSIPMTIVISLVLVGFVIFLIVYVPLLGVFAGVFLFIPFLTLWLRRQQEYEADLIAAQIGYGLALVVYLQRGEETGQPKASWRKRIVATHPSSDERVLRLQAWLDAHQSSGGEDGPKP